MPRNVATLVLVACALHGFAQTDSVSGKVHTLDTVIVSHSRSRRMVQHTAPLHVLGRSDMLSMGVSDMADALHRLPGITLRDYGGAGGMKTVSVRGFGARHTGVSYDGILLNNSQTGEIDLSRYSLDNVQSLSLVIGDNDDIFMPARHAAGASLLLIETLPTLLDDMRPRFTSQVKFGSFGYVSPFVRYRQNVSSRFALSAVGEYIYAENDYPFTLRNVKLVTQERRNNSRMKSGHAELNSLWQPDNHHQLKTKVYYYDNDQQLPGVVRYYAKDSYEKLRNRNFFTQTQYRWMIDSRWALKWYGKFNWSGTAYREGIVEHSAMDVDYRQREGYTSVSLLYAPTGGFTFNYAVDYAFQNLSSSAPNNVGPYRHSLLQSLSAKYADGRFKVLARLLSSSYFNGAKVGMGADNMKRLSPSLSLSYQLLRRHDLYVRTSYKNIFRVPTFNENYFYRYGSRDLKPELTDQWNVGLTYQKQCNRFNVEATCDAYLNHVKDKIVAVPYNMFVWRTINVGKVRMLGVDATVRSTYRMAKHHAWVFAANYSYQRAANRTLKTSPYYNNQIAYIPEHSGSVSLGYQSAWINVTVHGSGVSSKWINTEHHEGSDVPGYMEWGVTAYRSLQLLGHSLLLKADLKNVFDKQYHIVAGYPMPGIHYQVTIHYQI